MKNTIITIIVGLMAVVIIAQHCAIKAPNSSVSVQTIVSAIEIQQRLKDTGKRRYDPGIIDGKIGSKSQKAWDNYVCDQQAQAKKYFVNK